MIRIVCTKHVIEFDSRTFLIMWLTAVYITADIHNPLYFVNSFDVYDLQTGKPDHVSHACDI